MSFRNTLLVLLFGGTLGMWLLSEQQHGTLEPVDRVHREFLKANPGDGRMPAPEHPSVVFARLDDVDLQQRHVFDTWPLNEADWQIILQDLPGYEPKVTALDMDLTFPKVSGVLEAAAKNVRSLCVAPLLSVSPGDGAQALPPGMPLLKVSGSVQAIPEFKSSRESPIPGLLGAGRIDLVDKKLSVSMEGDMCRVPLLARMGDKVVPTLALRALLVWAEVPLDEVTVAPGAAITAGKKLRIEIDDAGLFRFYLSHAPQVPSVNADNFVHTRDQSEANLPKDSRDRQVLLGNLKGGLLWMGLNDVNSRTLEEKPGGTHVSPSDLTARAIAVIQTNTQLLPLPQKLLWIAPAVTLLFCVWLTHWRKSRLWPGAVVAAVALIGVSLWLYRRDHLWLPLAPSLALVVLTVILSYLLPPPKPRPAPETGTRRTMRPTRSTPSIRTSTRPPAATPRETAPLVTETLVSDPPTDPEPAAAFREPDTEVESVPSMTQDLPYEAAGESDDEAPEEDGENSSSPHQLDRPQRQEKEKKKKKRRR